jgi:hypothetical protein
MLFAVVDAARAALLAERLRVLAVVGAEVFWPFTCSDAHDFDGVTDHVGGALLAFGPLGIGDLAQFMKDQIRAFFYTNSTFFLFTGMLKKPNFGTTLPRINSTRIR